MTPARTLTLVLICARAYADTDRCNLTSLHQQKHNLTTDTTKQDSFKSLEIASEDLNSSGNEIQNNEHFNWTGEQYYKLSVVSEEVHNLTGNQIVDVRKAFAESSSPDVFHNNVIIELSDEEYYSMPRLFELDDYASCLAVRGVYCLGSFELASLANDQLFLTMQRFSSNWVDNYNHTRLHRGVCLTRSCSSPSLLTQSLEAWFESCVNTSTVSKYNLTTKLYHLDYCYKGKEPSNPLNISEKAFAVLITLLLLLAAISTSLDIGLSDCAKKDYGWALSWSLKSSWRSLVTPAPSPRGTDLRFFDGLRVFCMMGVIVEHICWLTTQAYVGDARFVELNRRSIDGMLLSNSTVLVQIFFLMASFLLAHKMLQEKIRGSFMNFMHMMLNRIIRVSPSYFIVVWFASSWWERIGSGAQWTSLVRSEAAVCRQKWWSQLLYLTNMVNTDEKCLIQTWYLAADMQLYALSLALVLVLQDRRTAIPILGALLIGSSVMNLALAYVLKLIPTYVVHNPELIRESYKGEQSFDWMYTSPQSNAAGALAGLLLAYLYHAIQESGNVQRLASHKMFRWASIISAPLAVVFVAVSPRYLGTVPGRLPAAVLAAFERPIFIILVAVALLGAIVGVDSPWRRWMSSGTTLARLSFGALLLHMLIIKSYLATRPTLAHLDRQSIYIEWFGISLLSYAAAIPLALLVELPAQRLHKELSARRKTAKQKNSSGDETNSIFIKKCKAS